MYLLPPPPPLVPVLWQGPPAIVVERCVQAGERVAPYTPLLKMRRADAPDVLGGDCITVSAPTEGIVRWLMLLTCEVGSGLPVAGIDPAPPEPLEPAPVRRREGGWERRYSLPVIVQPAPAPNPEPASPPLPTAPPYPAGTPIKPKQYKLETAQIDYVEREATAAGVSGSLLMRRNIHHFAGLSDEERAAILAREEWREAKPGALHNLVSGVYLIRADNGLYKIGYSVNVYHRFAALQSANAGEIELVHIIETDKLIETETDLHRKFRDKRIRGEWFRLDEEDVASLCGEGVPSRGHTPSPTG